MKVLRLSLFALLGLVGLALAAIAVAFTSSFQTWAARKAIASQPGSSISIGRVDASTSHVRIEQFNVSQEGATLAFPSLDLDLPLFSAARGNIQVRKLVAKGWTIDLTKRADSLVPSGGLAPATGAVTPATGGSAEHAQIDPSTAFRGIVSEFKLPVDVSVDAVELEGELILPAMSGQPPTRAKVTITGGQLGAGKEAKFVVALSTTPLPTAPVNSLTANGSLAATMDTARTFSLLGAEVQVDARGPGFPAGAKLLLRGSISKANAGESYTLVAEKAGRKLVTIQSTYPGSPGSERQLAGAWGLDIETADLAPFAMGNPLPAFMAKGSGKFTFNTASPALSASGRIEATAGRLDVIQAELAAVGAVKVAAAFDFTQSGSSLRIAELSFDVSGARPVAVIRALQPFEFNAKTGELKVAEPAKDLLDLDLKGVPLAWAQRFARDLVISGDDLRGAFVVGARNGGFAVRSVVPVSVTNLSVGQGDKPLVQGVAFSAKLAADYSPQGWQAECTDSTVRIGSSTLLTLSAKAGQLSGPGEPIKITGVWNADLPAVLKQPVAHGIGALSAGSMAGDFVASVGAHQELQAKISFTGLALGPKSSPPALILPTLQADLRATLNEAGLITLNVPFLIECEGRKSDLTLSGTLTRRTAGIELDAKVASTALFVDDAQALSLSLTTPAPPGAAPASPPAPGRDSVPAWSGVNGKIVLALKKFIYRQKFEVSDMAGTLQVDAGAVKLEGLRAVLGQGSEVKLGGTVTFDQQAPNPYVLRADFTLDNFDTVPLFRALDPGKVPSVEGKFSAKSQLAGSGRNIGQLLERTKGDFILTSKGGIFRLLQAEVDKAQKTQAAVAVLGGLLGAVTGSEKLADYGNRTQIVTDIAKAVGDIPFDQLNVAVTRGEKLDFNLSDFTLISPELRLVGNGEIRHLDNTPILAQPLLLQLQLSARGKVGDLMNRVSMLDGKQDNLGYIGLIAPLKVSGTLDKPDTSEIKATFGQAVLGTLLKTKKDG